MTVPWPKPLWTSIEAAEATGGQNTQDWSATGVSIDSRTLQKGDLFIALTGHKLDGHAYVAQAFENGAAAALVSHKPDNVDDSTPLLIVPDTLEALRQLATAARARTQARIVGITGSVGKTGTKDMLAAAFGVLGLTHAAKASYNNHWGVPFTLAGLPKEAQTGIFEIGMNHAGEITPLSKLVRPDIAIITTVAPVHMAHFSSVEEIAAAKAEIFDGMTAGGTAILNRDNEWFDFLQEKAQSKNLKVLSFGEHEKADACLLKYETTEAGAQVTISLCGEELAYKLSAYGQHIALNTLAVLLAVQVAGGDTGKAVQALTALEPTAGRGRRKEVNIGDPNNPVTLIDESYNASPVAVRAALDVLSGTQPGPGGRRIAVLGDMYELGEEAENMHKSLAEPINEAGIDLVFTSGPLMKALYDSLPAEKQGRHNDDTEALAEIIKPALRPGDILMIKGSRGGDTIPRMQVVVEKISRET